jgi:hypothetical protein
MEIRGGEEVACEDLGWRHLGQDVALEGLGWRYMSER